MQTETVVRPVVLKIRVKLKFKINDKGKKNSEVKLHFASLESIENVF